MLAVGLGLTPVEFRPVIRRPLFLAVAVFAPCLLLPLISLALIRAFRIGPDTAAGMLLIAVSPAAALGNFYTYLARGRTALSVTMTAVSCVAAVGVMPLSLAALAGVFHRAAGVVIPMPLLIRQLALMLVVPILAGMAIRRSWPAVADRSEGVARGVSLTGLVLVVLCVLIIQSAQFAVNAPGILGAVTALTLAAMLAGHTVGWAAGAVTADRVALALCFPVRNIGLATAVAVTVFNRIEFAAFAAAYFLMQVPIMLISVAVHRRSVLRGAAPDSAPASAG